jgi:hypothetical protein
MQLCTHHTVSPLLYAHPHGYRGHEHGKKKAINNKNELVLHVTTTDVPYSRHGATKTTDYLWAAMSNAVRFRFMLGNVPDQIICVPEDLRGFGQNYETWQHKVSAIKEETQSPRSGLVVFISLPDSKGLLDNFVLRSNS